MMLWPDVCLSVKMQQHRNDSQPRHVNCRADPPHRVGSQRDATRICCRALSSKPAGRFCCCRSMRRTDRQTPDRYIDPAPQTMRAASVIPSYVESSKYWLRFVYKRLTHFVHECNLKCFRQDERQFKVILKHRLGLHLFRASIKQYLGNGVR